MNPDRPDTTSTDIGRPRRKLFGKVRADKTRRDLTDPDQVFDLAAEIARASDREAMRVTVAELRAIAQLAVDGGTVLSQATVLVEVVDTQDVAATQISRAARAFAPYVRPHMGKAP